MHHIPKLLSYLLITPTFILITGCQSITDRPNHTINEKSTMKQDIIDAETMLNAWHIMDTIIRKYDGEIVTIAPEPEQINVGVCFYRSISQDRIHEIEQELSQAIGKDIAVEISRHLYPPIGGLDDSVLEADPCVLSATQ